MRWYENGLEFRSKIHDAMEITTALVLKVIGGIIVGGAHRTIVRAAKEEGTGWWLAAMLVPGGSIVYGVRRFQEFIAVLLVMVAGFAILGGGVGLHFYQRLQGVQGMAASEPAMEREEEADFADDESADTVIAATPVSFATEAPRSVPASSADRLPVAADVPRRLQPKLQKLTERYARLAEERARLDPTNENAVRSFNLRAEDYQAARRQFHAELAD